MTGDRDHDGDDESGYDDAHVHDPRVVETRAMDLLELAVEVTARPDAEPDDVAPRRSVIDIDLDEPRYADDPVVVDPIDRPVVLGPEDGPADEATGDATPGVDPRIADRRDTVAVERRRRRLRILGGVVGLLALGAGVVAAVYSPALDVDRISIVGSKDLSAADVDRLTGVSVGDPILFVDPAAMERRLRTDPRFLRVAVNRSFPSTLSIRVTDRRRIAVVVGPHQGVVVGEHGVIIARARGDEFLQHVEVAEDPPTRIGSRLSAPLAAAVDVMGSLSYGVAVQIEKMSITPEGELVFALIDHRTLLFGTVDDAERKLLAMKTMLTTDVDLRNVCRIDVRVPASPTMRRNPDCDPAPPTTVAPPATDPAATDPVAPTAPTPDPAAPTTTVPAAPPADPAAPTTTLSPTEAPTGPLTPDTVPPAAD